MEGASYFGVEIARSQGTLHRCFAVELHATTYQKRNVYCSLDDARSNVDSKGPSNVLIQPRLTTTKRSFQAGPGYESAGRRLHALSAGLSRPGGDDVSVPRRNLHLHSFSMAISNNTGTVHAAPPMPRGSFLPGPNFFSAEGTAARTMGRTGGFAQNIAGDQPCAYSCSLSWSTRQYLTGGASTQILYCK